jgi:hypothetical protein
MAIEICQGPMDDPQWTQDRNLSLIIFYKRKNMNRLRVATSWNLICFQSVQTL